MRVHRARDVMCRRCENLFAELPCDFILYDLKLYFFSLPDCKITLICVLMCGL